MNEHPLETLYNSLKRDNYDVPDTYESFARTLINDTNARRTLYNSLMRDNYDVPDNYDSFNNTLFGQYTTREANIAAGVDEASVKARTAQQQTQRNTGTPGVVPNRFGLPTQQQPVTPMLGATPPTPQPQQSRRQYDYRPMQGSGSVQTPAAEQPAYRPQAAPKPQQPTYQQAQQQQPIYNTQAETPATPEFRNTQKMYSDAADKAWQKAEQDTKALREANTKKIEDIYNDEHSTILGKMAMAQTRAAALPIEGMAASLKAHDMEKMANDAWGYVADDDKEYLIDGFKREIMREAARSGGSGGTMSQEEAEKALREEAERRAKARQYQAMYDKAVAANAPKDVLDFLQRKIVEGNSLSKLAIAAARTIAGTRGDMDARAVATHDYGKGHRVADITGSVLQIATDPVTWAAGGVGKGAVKGATNIAERAAGAAATRRLAASKGGQLAQRMIGGSANFAAFEGLGNIVEQLQQGGVYNEETGQYEYSLKDVAKAAGHGVLLGGATGVVGGLVGNVGDKVFDRVASTAGKLAVRGGQTLTSIAAEGTIFAAPELISGEGDFDTWLESVELMAGFKLQHGLRALPGTMGRLMRVPESRAGFETRLRDLLQGRPDLALTNDEREELERGGYTDLSELAEAYKGIEGKLVRMGDKLPYDRFSQLMADNSISEAARAKMYYYVTGRGMVQSTVTAAEIAEHRDHEGDITYYVVKSYNKDGGVITSRTYKSKKAAEVEFGRLTRQSELNSIDMLEKLYDRLPGTDATTAKMLRDVIGRESGIDIDKVIGKEENRRTDEEKAALQDYLNTMAKECQDAWDRQHVDVNQQRLQPDWQEAYDMGYNADEQQRSDISIEREDNPNDPQAQAAWQGVEDRIRQDAADRADQRRAEGERMAYKGKGDMQGAIRPLTINEESKEEVVNPQTGEKERKKKVVYLVNGNIAIGPNGNGLSREGTDKTIYVYDPETGDTHELDPFGGAGVLSVGDVVSMEDYLANNEQQSQAEVQQAAETAQGKVKVNTPFETPQGRQGVVQSIEGDNAIVLFADGEMEQASMPLAEVQQYADALRRQEYEARHPQETPAEQPQQPNTATEGQAPTAGQTTPQEGNNADTRTPAQRTYDDVVAKLGADRASKKIDATAKVKSDRLAKAQKALKTAQETADNTEYGSKEEQKAEEAVVKAQAEYDAAQQDMAAWDEVRKLRDQALLAQAEQEEQQRKAELERKRAEETEAQRKQREAYEAEQARRKAEAEAAEKRRQGENERLKQQAANPQPAEQPAPIEGTKGQASQLEIARQELEGDPEALAMLDETEPRTLVEVAATLLASGKNATKLLKEDFKRETGYSDADAKRYPFLFAGADKGGITLARFGEMVVEAAREYGVQFDENDATAGIDAALELLGSVSSQADINDYITNSRIAEAYDYHNAALGAARARMLEDYGMTEGEYESYMSWLEDAIEQGKSTLSDEEFNQLFNVYEQGQTTDVARGNQEGAETTERPEGAETDVSQNGERGNGETDEGEQPQQPAVNTAYAPTEEEYAEIKAYMDEHPNASRAELQRALRLGYNKAEIGKQRWESERAVQGETAQDETPAAGQTEGTAEQSAINPNYKPKSERELLEQEKRELEDNLVKYRKGLEDNDPMEVTNHKWYRNQIKITEDRLAEIDKRLTELNNKAGEQPKQEPKAEKEETNEPKEPKRLISDEQMDELKERLRKKLRGQLNSGIDPETLSIGLQLAVGHIERGLTKFADFAKRMIEDLGDAIRPYLKSFYNGARDFPGAEKLAEQMTPYDEVRTFDVENFDKERPSSLVDTAKEIAAEQEIEKQVEQIKKPTKGNKKEDSTLSNTEQGQLDLFGSPSDTETETPSESNLKFTEEQRAKVSEWVKADPSTDSDVRFRGEEGEDVRFRLREDEEPTKTGTGYKVFVLKDGKLYPPMVANPNGEATPVGVWLDADAAPVVGESKTGRPQVKAGGKGTQGGSGQLAYRPGWHLGTIPYALQFNRKNPETGEKDLFPANFVWAEVDYANDIDYQDEARAEGMNASGKYQHSLAGLKRVPVNGSYMYRTNPDPNTDPWIITGAMRVRRILKPSEVDEMVRAAGREPQKRQEGAITDAQIDELNDKINSRLREGGEEAYAGEWYDRGSVERIGSFAGYTSKQIAKMNARQEQSARKQFNDTAEKLHLSDNITFADSIDDVQGLTDEERKERRDKKGWYDIKTGKIVIILGNHKSMDDVMKSILHEGVAHHGLRQMFGEHFNTFLDNVYRVASPEIRDRINTMAKKHGWDFREATEEYLAMLAEDTDFERPENQSWWKQVKDWFIDMLHKIGFKLHDAYDTVTDNELRYILWRSYENLVNPGRYNSVVEEAKDVAKQYELKVGQWDETWTIAAEEEPNATIEYGGRRIPIWATNGRRGNRADRVERNDRMGSEYNVAADGVAEDAAEYSAPEGLNGRSNENRERFKEILDNSGLKYRDHLSYKNGSRYFSFSIKDKNGDYNTIRVRVSDHAQPKEWRGNYEEGVNDFRNYADAYNYLSKFFDLSDKRNAIAEKRKELAEQIEEIEINGEKAYRIKGNDAVFSTPEAAISNVITSDFVPRMTGQLVDEFAEDGVRFRDGEDDKYTPKAQARGLYERAMNDWWNQFTEAMQDSMMSVKKLVMSVLEARGEKGKKMRIEDVAGYENPWLAENRLRGSIKNQVFAWQRDYMEPLQKAIYDITGGIKPAYDELMDYMMAKHGLERNEVLAKRDAKKAWEDQNKSEIGNPNYTAAKNAAFANIDAGVDDLYLEQRKKDYAGLTALTGKEDVEEAEKKAQRMVDEYEKRYDTTKLWEATNRATRSSLFTMLECGMMTPKRHAEIRDMFKYYIPLQGFDSDVAEDVYAYMGSDGTRLYGTAIRAAKGRKSKADDPIATIAMNGEAAIRRGNRNLMKQHFLRFVQAHPSDLVSINDVWLRKNANGEWEQYFDADLKETDTPEEVADKVRDFNERMEQEAAANPDIYKRSRDLPNVPFRVLNTRDMKQHQVMVQVNGNNYLLTVNGNPRAAQALNGLSNPDVFTESVFGKAMNIAQSVTRELSQFYTTRKPSFVLGNFSRDSIYTNLIVGVKEDKEYSRAFHKNWVNMNPATMGKLFSEWVNGELRDKILAGTATDTERMFNDFLMYGGETGWISMRDIERQKKDLQKALKQEGNTAAQKWKSFWATVDLANRAVENCARFAAFMTSQQMGRSIERSVWDAKEISVNFEKKGAGDKFLGSKNQTVGGWIGAVIGGWCRGNFAFWNAGVQGISNFYRAAKKKPGKFALRIFAMNFTLGMMAPLISALLGGDDDDENSYFNLPEYKRRNNLCFRFTKHMPWITIPLPIEFRAIYGLGELAMCHMLGKEHFYNGWDCAKAYMQQLSQVLPLDFLEGGGGWHVIFPTYAKPAVEAYANESWTGLPIYKENKYGQYDNLPEWQRAYPNTNMLLVNGTRWINEATVSGDLYTGGNNEDVKGFINWNPARIEYMLRGYLGGYYSMYEHSAKTISTIAGKREFEWRNIPLAHVLITEGDERTAERSIKNEYYKIVDDYENTDHKVSQYDEKSHTEKENEERRQKLNTDKRYLRHEIVDIYKTLIDKLNDTKKNADEEEKKAIEEYQAGLRKEMVDMVHNLESKSKSELEKGDNLGQIDELAEQALGSRYESGDLSVRKAIGSMTAKRIGERYGSEARDGYGSGSALDTEYGKIYEKHRTYTDMAGDIMLNEEIKRATAEKDYVRLDALEGAKKDIADNRDDLNQYMTQEAIDNIMEVIRKIRRNALYPEQAANPTDNVEE